MNITRVLVPAALSALFALTSTSFARNQSEESRAMPRRKHWALRQRKRKS